jgi:hypothetical protein
MQVLLTQSLELNRRASQPISDFMLIPENCRNQNLLYIAYN